MAEFQVVGIGASAGGLEAFRTLLDTLPANTGMAFILVQHLDPTHASMMVELLATHTAMPVCEAGDGMKLLPNHVYVISPGTALSVTKGKLRVSSPTARHGTRLPVDFLLHALALAFGGRAICVILSGTGADGSLGAAAVKQHGGFVIVQDPEEAAFEGMPRSAIDTGAVDLVLGLSEIATALIDRAARGFSERAPRGQGDRAPRGRDGVNPQLAAQPDETFLPAIIGVLRDGTTHDFTLYKTGTLMRRIERRMSIMAIQAGRMDAYLELLKGNPGECVQLAKDLLINVTGFFRDPEVFTLLARDVIPELIRLHPADQALRIWTAGCSTGEETYSLGILIQEAIAASGRHIKLQMFASDVDSEAVASAREGLYPETIVAEVTPARLARFFSKEGAQYRISTELRSATVFTVQDILTDPPFSRIDLVSCRNLLIYLQPEAQARAIAAFHFALRTGGILLLGNAETIGNDHGQFEVISKSARLFRNVKRNTAGAAGFPALQGDRARVIGRLGQVPTPARQNTFAETCRRVVIETYAPASILINSRNECVYSLGPTDRYMRVPPGQATHDLLAMVRLGMRAKLADAIQTAHATGARAVVDGAWRSDDDAATSFSIDVQPVENAGEKLLLICFVDDPKTPQEAHGVAHPDEAPRVAVLEQELDSTRAELRAAVRNLEIAYEEQTTINEEASSVNEEYQSTNEELLTSKEELQSLNEELTALNGQLQETLERQRTTSDDLQNVLYSTDVATLFLDLKLNIRFFTPATKALFRVIPTDVGRPLADLKSLVDDRTLLEDAQSVLDRGTPIEREIEAPDGKFHVRRILPYLTKSHGREGVVITFLDITERRRATDALAAAKRVAELASMAKSRFLAVASHDLRQPLQTLTLLQGLLVKTVEGERAARLVDRFDKTLSSMAGMLNTLLDINQIEAGTIVPAITVFPMDVVLNNLREEFVLLAHAQGVVLRVVGCAMLVRTDQNLLEQMLRNILSNALKYTRRGKVLLGCRHEGGGLRIEILDTGMGIPTDELETIFEEYYQVGTTARERSRGLGLGLSIVRRLGGLLRHQVRVRSVFGKGSKFSVTLLPESCVGTSGVVAVQSEPHPLALAATSHTAQVLIVEDDPEVAELLLLVLTDAGHEAVRAPDGPAALAMLARDGLQPDIVLADFNLPHAMNGLEAVLRIRTALGRAVPAVFVTGDISTATLRDIARHDCVQLNKPVTPAEILNTIAKVLRGSIAKRAVQRTPPRAPVLATVSRAPESLPANAATPGAGTNIYIVDDDSEVCDSLRLVFEEHGSDVETFPSAEAFLAWRDAEPSVSGCLVVDARLPGISGVELLRRLAGAGRAMPSLLITGHGDVDMAVQAMKAGASDFIEKPVSMQEVLASVAHAMAQSHDTAMVSERNQMAATQIGELTARQREILDLVLLGHPSKNIAADLGISRRTVENHRAAIMRKTGSRSLPALARLALAAAEIGHA